VLAFGQLRLPLYPPPLHPKMQGAFPVPAPRRTVYKRAASQDISPPVARRRSVAPTAVQNTLRPGGRPSRAGTPARMGSVRDDDDSVAGMDLDDVAEEVIVERGLKFETIFAKSEELQASFYAHLPAEVKLLLRNAGTECGVQLWGCVDSEHCDRFLP
jgi:nuclear pore complex protein Nup133